MAVILHSEADYYVIKKELTRRQDSYFGEFIRIAVYLCRFHSTVLTAAELRVFMFLLGRTLAFKKRTERVAFSEFLGGVFSSEGKAIAAPCGLAKDSIRAALAGLEEKGFTNAHAFPMNNAMRTERKERMYEIRVDDILLRSEEVMPPSELEEAIKAASAPLPNTRIPPSEKTGDRSNRSLSNSSSKEDSATAAPRKRTNRASSESMAKRIEIDCNEDPRDLVKRIGGRAQATQATRVAISAGGVPKKRWTKNDLQALLDKARADAIEHGYTVPRVLATDKGLGVLHKRMLEKEVTDPLGVLTWIFQNWTHAASANQRSVVRARKDSGEVTGQKGIQSAPNFTDLSYRFPWFIALYESRDQEAKESKTLVEQRKERFEHSRAVQDSVANVQMEVARLRDELAEERRKKDEAVFNTRRIRRTRPAPADDDDFAFPLHISERRDHE